MSKVYGLGYRNGTKDTLAKLAKQPPEIKYVEVIKERKRPSFGQTFADTFAEDFGNRIGNKIANAITDRLFNR